MSNKIYPIIFFSISLEGKEMVDSIEEFSTKINHPFYSRFIRFIYFNADNTITNNLDSEKLILGFSEKDGSNKLDNFSAINQNRSSFLSVFKKLINDIKNIENNNFAIENNYEIEKTQIVVLSSIENPNLSPLTLPLIFHYSLKTEIDIHFLLLFNQKLSNDKSNESRILKNAFFREIETIVAQKKPKIWLLDIVNEEQINLASKSNLLQVACLFADILLTDAASIDMATNSHGIANERPCMYSSIGYSILRFPVEKIKEYLFIYSSAVEYGKLAETFDKEFDSIMLKDELSKFLSRNGFEEIPEKISKKDDKDDIFVSFLFDGNQVELEKKEVLSNKLSKISSPSTLSKTKTTEFFQKIDEEENIYKKDIFIDFSFQLNNARKRESIAFGKLIKKAILKFIDDKNKGINYSLLFGAILVNDKAVVENMLNGRFVQDIPTLISLQDKYRSVFIGDEIDAIEKELRIENDNCSNKLNLINEYSAALKVNERDALKINSKLDAGNPKLAELSASISNFKSQLVKLNNDVIAHNGNIAKLKSKVEKIKSDFDLDAFKVKYKEKRNAENIKNLEKLRTKDVVSIDDQLGVKYETKNKILLKREKFIFYKFIIIPSVILISLLIIQFGLFFSYELFDFSALINSLKITFVIEILYSIIVFFQFYFLGKKMKLLTGDIEDLLQKKKNILQTYVSKLKNNFFNNYSFEKDIISLDLITSLVENSSKLYKSVELFKSKILDEKVNFHNLSNTYDFNESSFEICVIKKEELNNIYNSNSNDSIFDISDGNKLSSCFDNYLNSDRLIKLKECIDIRSKDIFQSKIIRSNLKSILFNKSELFGSKINTKAKFKILIDTSRPLLQTTKFYFPNLNFDIPYTENIFIGCKDDSFDEYLNEELSFNSSVKIDKRNKNIFGILSIKSNFPSFIIDDVKETEDLIRTEVNKDNKSNYFTHDSAYNYQLLPSKANNFVMMGSELITALTQKEIVYDIGKNKFTHAVLGDLGMKFEDLITFWNQPLCYEIKEKFKEIDADIWQFDEDDLNDFLKKFKIFWCSFKIKMPRIFEEEVAEYFFAHKGSEENWKEIKLSLKENSKLFSR